MAATGRPECRAAHDPIISGVSTGSPEFTATGGVSRWRSGSFKGVTPRWPFDPAAHQWGAFELVARAGALRVEEDAFPRYADPARAARVARDRGIGVNGYLSRNFRLMLDSIETRFPGGATAAAGGDRPDERVLLNRFQVAW